MNAQVSSTPTDQWVACAQCGAEFAFTIGEQDYYAQKKISPPRRCRACREKKKLEFAEHDRLVAAAEAAGTRKRGTIHSYDPARGWGFLRRDGSSEDIFFHASALYRTKQRQIVVGAAVGFVEIDSVRRPGSTCAERVQVIPTQEGAKP
jgi:cold shock CspA family protein